MGVEEGVLVELRKANGHPGLCKLILLFQVVATLRRLCNAITSLPQLLGTVALDHVDNYVVEVRGTQHNLPHASNCHKLPMHDQNAEHNIPAVLSDDAGHGGAEKLPVSWVQWQYPKAGEENNRVLVETLDASIHPFMYSVEVAPEIKIITVLLVYPL